MPEPTSDGATSLVQDTGNPVLDSTVNILMANSRLSVANLPEIHARVLELARKEPGGLRYRGQCSFVFVDTGAGD